MTGFTAQYSKASDLTLFVGQGSLTADDFVAAMETHYGKHPSSLAIWDLAQSDLSNLDMPALIRIAEGAMSTAKQRKNPRNLIVLAAEQESNLVRLYEEISEMRGSPVRYQLYFSRAEAYGALGIEDPFAD